VIGLKAMRFFTKKDKFILFQFASGLCCNCSKPLTSENYHADHIKPYANGGKTDIKNGQALCCECNLKKGSK